MAYEMKTLPNGGASYSNKPLLLGAPEIDYYIFLEDLRYTMTKNDFFDDEIEEAIVEFKKTYCLLYHRHLTPQNQNRKNDCEFPSKSFSDYAKIIAQLTITVEYPDRFDFYFSEYLK